MKRLQSVLKRKKKKYSQVKREVDEAPLNRERQDAETKLASGSEADQTGLKCQQASKGADIGDVGCKRGDLGVEGSINGVRACDRA